MRLVKLNSVLPTGEEVETYVNPEHVRGIGPGSEGETIVIFDSETDARYSSVKGTPAEVAALLAGEGESETIERPYLMELANLLVGPLTKDDFFTGPDLVAEVKSRAAKEQSLTAEVERLRGERDEALCSWESEAADNASLRSEVERLKGDQDDLIKDMDAVELEREAAINDARVLMHERDEARAALEAVVEAHEIESTGPLVPDWSVRADEMRQIADDALDVLESAPAPEPEEPAPTEPANCEFCDGGGCNACGWTGYDEPAGEAGDEGAGESGQTPGSAGAESVSPPADSVIRPEPAPATPTEPTVTTIDARSRIAIQVHGECVVDRSPNSNVATVYIRPGGKVTATPPDGLELYATITPDDVVWDDPMNKVLGPTGTAWIDVGTEYLWTRDPSRIGDKNFEYPEGACVVTVRVVPEGEPWPGFPASPPFDSFDPGPAFLDPDAVYALIQSDPEAWRQMTEVLNRPRNSTNWRQHQRANAGTPDAGLTPGGTGSQGWDLLGDVLCYGALKRGLAIGGESIESVRDIIRSKFRDNWLRTRPFGIVGKDWDEGTPFRRTWARTSYRSFVDVLDEALALRFAFDDGTAAELLDAQTLDMVLSDLRHFAAFVEADMKVSDPRMWRTSNVLSVECLRHLFPSLALPDLSGYLTRWDGDVKSLANSVLTPEDPPRWLDKGDYTAHHMMGVCYSVWFWIADWAKAAEVPPNHHLAIANALRIWTGIDGDWMWAKKTGTPQDGQDHRCARFTNSLTQIWFPTNRDAASLGSQDHALYVVAGCRVAS